MVGQDGQPSYAGDGMSEGFCNGCTICCKNDAVRLLPGEDVSLYQTTPHEYFPGELMLDHKENRDCVYLGDSGCTIHETKPIMCGEMDCRNLARKYSKKQVKKLNIPMAVWNKGRLLICR